MSNAHVIHADCLTALRAEARRIRKALNGENA